jgi:small-conductance mechanosensitive channel
MIIELFLLLLSGRDILYPEKEEIMKKNMGIIDRSIRILLAAAVALFYFTDQLTGIAAVVLGAIAVIFILTSVIGFCPLYYPLGISTRKKG